MTDVSPLADLLGDDLPDSVTELDPAAQQRLVEMVRSAKRQHHVVVGDALDAAVKGVPMPFRGLVKKAVR